MPERHLRRLFRGPKALRTSTDTQSCRNLFQSQHVHWSARRRIAERSCDLFSDNLQNGLASSESVYDSLVTAGQQRTLEDHLGYIRKLVSRGGPEIDDYAELDAWFTNLFLAFDSGHLPNDALGKVREAFGEVFTNGTMFGHAFRKPHGYSGDFEIIDRFYGSYAASGTHEHWDRYIQAGRAPRAVRNRKTYLHDLLRRRIEASNGQTIRVLNVASGPGRDIAEFLSGSSSNIQFDCIDQDPSAIRYASALCAAFVDRVTFLRADILRFRPRGKYDLIWAAGLFDYFSDRVFKLVLRRLLPGVAPGGEIVIGNFSSANPNQHWLRLVEWHLNHRSPEQLQTLGSESGVNPDRIKIGRERESVNLFLHIRNG